MEQSEIRVGDKVQLTSDPDAWIPVDIRGRTGVITKVEGPSGPDRVNMYQFQPDELTDSTQIPENWIEVRIV